MRALVWLIVTVLLGLLLLALLIPLSLDFLWSEGEGPALVLRLFYLFRIRLLPQKEKHRAQGDKSPAEDEKKKREVTEKQKKFLKRDFLDQLGLVCEAVKTLSSRVLRLLGHVTVKKMRVELCITREDAAGTALEYGKVCSYLAASYAFLQNFLRFGAVRFEVTPDFTAAESGVRQRVTATVCLRPIFVLQMLLASLADIVKLVLRAKNKRPNTNARPQKPVGQPIKQ